jgi:hypothetical protein
MKQLASSKIPRKQRGYYTPHTLQRETERRSTHRTITVSQVTAERRRLRQHGLISLGTSGGKRELKDFGDGREARFVATLLSPRQTSGEGQ